MSRANIVLINIQNKLRREKKNFNLKKLKTKLKTNLKNKNKNNGAVMSLAGA